LHHFAKVRGALRQAREDLPELAVVEAEMALEYGGKDGTVVGGHREVATLVKLG
jgi:hypothetical protein